jgi:N-acylneuraminate cytidylyltransferase
MNINSKARKIKLFAIDVDGVLTDGGMYYSENGECLKKFNAKDGMAIELLRDNGIVPVIITKENSNIVLRRAEKLKVQEVHVGVENKAKVIDDLIKKYDLSLQEVAYIGDDVNDLSAMERVGLRFCVADAEEEVRSIADYVTKRRGGNGAVREATNMLLKCLRLSK